MLALAAAVRRLREGGSEPGEDGAECAQELPCPRSRVRQDSVPAWEELPEASRAAAGCLMAVLMVRMIRAGRAGADEGRA